MNAEFWGWLIIATFVVAVIVGMIRQRDDPE
jgi:hypothetical protein